MSKRKRRELPSSSRPPLEPLEAIPDVLKRDGDAVPSQPSKKESRDRTWDANRSKTTYDLPAGLIQRVKEIADELKRKHGAKVRVSDVARLLLEAGIDQYEAAR